MAQFLGDNGLIPTKPVQEAAVRVLEAVQILMRAGSNRLDAESVVRRIAKAARSVDFVATYARMNPACGLRHNVFYFGKTGAAPRAVIFGPYLYVHAPGIRLPKGLEILDEDVRRKKHLGALHARLRVTDSASRRIVEKLSECLTAAGDE